MFYYHLFLKWLSAVYPRKSKRKNPIESLFFLWNDGLSFHGKSTLALCFLLSLFSLRSGGEWPLFIALAGALAVFFALILAQFWPIRPKGIAHRLAPSRVRDQIPFDILWEYKGEEPLLFFERNLPDGLSIQKKHMDRPCYLTLVAHRPGYYELSGAEYHWAEWMGLAFARRASGQKDPLGLWVLHCHPQILWSPKLDYLGLNLGPGQSGQEREWQKIRPFQNGDRLRDLDAKSSARFQRLMSRDYVQIQEDKPQWWILLPAPKLKLSQVWVYWAQLRFASAWVEKLAENDCLGGVQLDTCSYPCQSNQNAAQLLELLATQDFGFKTLFRALKHPDRRMQSPKSESHNCLENLPANAKVLVLGADPDQSYPKHWILMGPNWGNHPQGLELKWQDAWESTWQA